MSIETNTDLSTICEDEPTRGALLQMFMEREYPELIPEFAKFAAAMEAALMDEDDDDEED